MSIVKLLCLNSCTHPIVDCLASAPGLRATPPTFPTFASLRSAFGFETFASPSPFSRGRYAFSRRIQASPFSAAAAMTDSRVSKSHSAVNTSNSGRTTFTRNPFWCLAKM